MTMLMIGELARCTGAKVNTIRFYEDIELMPPAARTDSGRRTYGDTDVRRLRFILNNRIATAPPRPRSRVVTLPISK